MEKESQIEDSSANRRGFVRKLLRVAALGGLGALFLGERPEKAAAGISPAGTGDSAAHTFIGSDNNNNVYDDYGVITGGADNIAGTLDGDPTLQPYATVSGGWMNHAHGEVSTVIGGRGNEASGYGAVVAGGLNNVAAGDYSFAAGRRAKSNHGGSFLFADNSSDQDFNSAAADEFAVRCSGGARFVFPPADPSAKILLDSSRTDGGVAIQGLGTSGGVSDLGLRIKNTSAQGNEWYLDSTGSDGVHTSGYGPGKLAFVCGLGSSPTMTLTPDSNVGIGTTNPVRQLHISGNNATVRIDRNVDSSQFLLVRTSADFSTVWKTFVFGVKATGADAGKFFIGDMHTNVGGSSDNRLLIDTSGNVGIGTTTPTERLHVAGNVKATGFITGDITMANDYKVTEDERDGIAFLNPEGEKIAVLDREGNLRIKGRLIQES